MPITTINRRQLLRAEPRPIIGPGPRSAPPIIQPAEPTPAIAAKPKRERRPVTPAEFERIAASAPPNLANLLRGLWASDLSVGELRDMKTADHSGYLFPIARRDGGQATTDQIVKAISKLCAAAGVPATSSDISGGAARCAGGGYANVA